MNDNPLALLRDWLRQFGYYFAYTGSQDLSSLDTIYIGHNGWWLGFVVLRNKVYEIFPYNPGGARLPIGEVEIADPSSFDSIHRLLAKRMSAKQASLNDMLEIFDVMRSEKK